MYMKGDMLDIFSTIIFIGAAVATILFLNEYFISYRGGVQTPIENLEALQAAYAVEACLSSLSGGDYVTSDFLDSKNGMSKSVNEICGISDPPMFVRITDIDSGKEWVFIQPADDALESIFDWTRDKLSIWKKRKETSNPKHSIFIPILYEKVAISSENAAVLGSGRKYVLVYSNTGDSLKLDIYPLERYGKDVAGMQLLEIKDAGDLKSLADDMAATPQNTERTKLVAGHLYRDVKAGDIIGQFELADPDECGGSADGKICMTQHEGEMHGGMLYVKI